MNFEKYTVKAQEAIQKTNGVMGLLGRKAHDEIETKSLRPEHLHKIGDNLCKPLPRFFLTIKDKSNFLTNIFKLFV